MKQISCHENSSGCIFKLHSNNLTFEQVFMLKNILNDYPLNKPVALNLNNVDCVCMEFLELLKETSNNRPLSLTSLQSEILVLLNLTKYDKFSPVFLNDFDFLEQKRALINRNFFVLGNS